MPQSVEVPLQVNATVSVNGTLAKGRHNPVDATGGNRTVTLPTGATAGAKLSVMKMDSSANTVTVAGNIRGVVATSLVLEFQHQSLLFLADAAGSWWPIADYRAPTSFRLDNLPDVATTGAVAGQSLVFGVNGQWVPGSVTGGGAAQPTALNDLTDVTIDPPAHGTTLHYNANTQQWENTPVLVGNLILAPGEAIPAGTPPCIVWNLPTSVLKNHPIEATAGGTLTNATAATENFNAWTGAAATYVSTPTAAVGTTSLQVLHGNQGYGTDSGLNLTTAAIRMFVRFPSTPTAPTADAYFAIMYSAGAVAVAHLTRKLDGTVSLKNGTAAQQGVVTSTVLALDTWYRIEWKVGSSSQTLRIYNLAGTLLETATRAASAGSIDMVRYGIPGSTLTSGLFLDACAVSTDWVGAP